MGRNWREKAVVVLIGLLFVSSSILSAEAAETSGKKFISDAAMKENNL